MPVARTRRWGVCVAFAVSAVAALGAVSLNLPASHAASGTVVETAPGTVFNLSGCTGFAISESVLLTAKACGITRDRPLISMTGDRPQVIKVIDVPDMDAQAVVSDARNLVPFSVGPVQPGSGVTVYGYGRSRDDDRGALVMRQAELGSAHEAGSDGVFTIDVTSQADTACEGDSGGPALQGGSVTGIIVGGDGPPCGTAFATALSARPAFDWLKSQGIV